MNFPCPGAIYIGNIRVAKNLLKSRKTCGERFSRKIIFLADYGDATHTAVSVQQVPGLSVEHSRDADASGRVWRGRSERGYRDQRPYGLSVARSGKGEKEKTRTRPRKHPTSDRQAPMVSKHRASVRTGPCTGCLRNEPAIFR